MKNLFFVSLCALTAAFASASVFSPSTGELSKSTLSLASSSSTAEIQKESSPALIGEKAVGDSVLELLAKEVNSDPTVFNLGETGFTDLSWSTSGSLLIEAKNGDDVSVRITGDIIGGVVSNASMTLFAGGWDSRFEATYSVSDTDVKLSEFFNMLMVGLTGTATATDANGDSYEVTAEFAGQSWLVDDYVNNEFTNARLTLSSTLIPEPATLAILGFGGLFLIRKKRRQ